MYIVHRLVHMLHRSTTLWVINRGAYGNYGKIIDQKTEVLLKLGTFVKNYLV